ncbi:hypothetical protein M5689_012348 [Euphorbia peplus]|nr:hypothetical protein M5689_012348 [Euphorbia peplus]
MKDKILLLMVITIPVFLKSIKAQTWKDPNCSDIVWDFLPCLNFLHGVQSSPSWGCCSQIKDLNKIAKNKTGRRRICQCIEDTAHSERMHLLHSRINELAGNCGVKPEFPISNHMDCKKAKEFTNAITKTRLEKDAHFYSLITPKKH